MLFNEPKLLKLVALAEACFDLRGFSALQRAEIAEMRRRSLCPTVVKSFSALQRAEIAEIVV